MAEIKTEQSPDLSNVHGGSTALVPVTVPKEVWALVPKGADAHQAPQALALYNQFGDALTDAIGRLRTLSIKADDEFLDLTNLIGPDKAVEVLAVKGRQAMGTVIDKVYRNPFDSTERSADPFPEVNARLLHYLEQRTGIKVISSDSARRDAMRHFRAACEMIATLINEKAAPSCEAKQGRSTVQAPERVVNPLMVQECVRACLRVDPRTFGELLLPLVQPGYEKAVDRVAEWLGADIARAAGGNCRSLLSAYSTWRPSI